METLLNKIDAELEHSTDYREMTLLTLQSAKEILQIYMNLESDYLKSQQILDEEVQNFKDRTQEVNDKIDEFYNSSSITLQQVQDAQELCNAIKEQVLAYSGHIDEIQDKIESDKQEMQTIKDDTQNLSKETLSYRDQTMSLKDEVATTATNSKTEIGKTISEAKEAFETNLNTLKENIDDVTSKLEGYKTELTTLVDDGKTGISTLADTTKTELSTLIDTSKGEITTLIDTGKTDITTTATNSKAEIENLLKDLPKDSDQLEQVSIDNENKVVKVLTNDKMQIYSLKEDTNLEDLDFINIENGTQNAIDIEAAMNKSSGIQNNDMGVTIMAADVSPEEEGRKYAFFGLDTKEGANMYHMHTTNEGETMGTFNMSSETIMMSVRDDNGFDDGIHIVKGEVGIGAGADGRTGVTFTNENKIQFYAKDGLWVDDKRVLLEGEGGSSQKPHIEIDSLYTNQIKYTDGFRSFYLDTYYDPNPDNNSSVMNTNIEKGFLEPPYVDVYYMNNFEAEKEVFPQTGVYATDRHFTGDMEMGNSTCFIINSVGAKLWAYAPLGGEAINTFEGSIFGSFRINPNNVFLGVLNVNDDIKSFLNINSSAVILHCSDSEHGASIQISNPFRTDGQISLNAPTITHNGREVTLS